MVVESLWVRFVLVGGLVFVGCGGGSDEDPPAPGETAPGSSDETAPSSPEESSAAPEPTAAENTAAPVPAGPVDLLRAVPTDIAVSSAYRDRGAQVPLLFDGDLTTAWNSRTGDLVGSWVEVRLPADASVTSIEMTAGFTRPVENGNEFAGNHRVSSVRVLRDGAEIGVYPLDVQSQALQTLPVSGGGGVYRIEMAEMVPGERSSWRETCISELRVLGSAPGAQPDQRFPRWATRELPEPRPAPGSTPRDQVQQQLTRHLAWFEPAWWRYTEERAGARLNTGEPEPPSADRAEWAGIRRSVFLRTATLVDLVDGVQADAVRRALVVRPRSEGQHLPPIWDFQIGSSTDEFAALADGIAAVVAWLDEDRAACRWATAEVGQRLNRIERQVEVDDMMARSMPPGEYGPEGGWSEVAADRVDGVASAWRDGPRDALPRVRDLRLPGDYLSAEYTAMRAAFDVARERCGWRTGG